MQKLKTIQQRVFCIFFRSYQRVSGIDTRGKIVDKLLEPDMDSMAWFDPTSCEVCYSSSQQKCPVEPKQFRPIGPSNLVESGESELLAITDPPTTKQLRNYKRALQFYDFKTDDMNEMGTVKPNIELNSKTFQPFNEDMLFTEDLWFLHSTWTSFEKTKMVARPLIDAFGFDSIMVCSYVPLNLELLPNK